MSKIIGISFVLLYLVALFFASAGRWLWARTLGVLSLILLLFSIWRQKSSGLLSTVLLSVIFIIYTWVSFWLYPTGVVEIAGTQVNKYNVVIVLLTGLVCILSLWMMFKYSRQQKGQGSTPVQRKMHKRR